MEENKSGGYTKINPAIFVILFIIALIFEFYWIMNYPYEYFMLFGIGIVALIFGFLAYEGIVASYKKNQKERYEQNEMLIKTQKALYLATKKSSASADLKAEQNIEAIKSLVSKIEENQLELTRLLQNNNRKSSDNDSSDIGGLVEQITRSNAKLAKEVQAAITVNELVKTNADLVKNVQEVLGQTINNVNLSSSVTDSISAPNISNNNEIPDSELAEEFTPEPVNEQTIDDIDEVASTDEELIQSSGVNDTDDTIAQVDDALNHFQTDDEFVDFPGLDDMPEESENAEVTDEIVDSSPDEASEESSDNPFNSVSDNNDGMLSQEEIAALFAKL